MFIQQITIEYFGSIDFYKAELAQKTLRQIIILTLPMDETLKKKWLGG